MKLTVIVKSMALLFAGFFISLASFAFISPKDAPVYVGEKVSICGKITAGKSPASNAARATIMQLADQSNGSSISVVIKNGDRKNFNYKPEEYLYSKHVCITGLVLQVNGRIEINLRHQNDVIIQDEDDDIRLMDFDGLNRYF